MTILYSVIRVTVIFVYIFTEYAFCFLPRLQSIESHLALTQRNEYLLRKSLSTLKLVEDDSEIEESGEFEELFENRLADKDNRGKKNSKRKTQIVVIYCDNKHKLLIESLLINLFCALM